MRRYRTEVVIPPDRYIGLQLPPHLPEGRAMVTVIVHDPEPAAAGDWGSEADRQDIEWWDEFDEELGAEPRDGVEGSAGLEP